MAKIKFTGFRYGIQKVEFTKLLKNEVGLSLKSAKDITNNLLDGEKITLELSNLEKANILADKANNLGVNCEVSEN